MDLVRTINSMVWEIAEKFKNFPGALRESLECWDSLN